jgi:hypothetical protein
MASLYVGDERIIVLSHCASSTGANSASPPIIILPRDAAAERIGESVLQALNAFRFDRDEQSVADAGPAAVTQAGFRSWTALERGAAHLSVSMAADGQAVITPFRAQLYGGYSGANQDAKSCATDPAAIGSQILALVEKCTPRGPFNVTPPPRPRNLDGLERTPSSDVPVSFCYKETWLAISCDDPQKVAASLHLKDRRESTWADGFGEIRENRRLAFVGPSIGGWTLVVGHVPGPHLNEFNRILCDLSAHFGEAQYYGNHRVSSLYTWGRAREGQLQRLFYYADELKGEVGPRTADEIELAIGQVVEDCWPDEDDVLKIASRWSFNPADLGDQKTFGHGMVGLIPCAK